MAKISQLQEAVDQQIANVRDYLYCRPDRIVRVSSFLAVVTVLVLSAIEPVLAQNAGKSAMGDFCKNSDSWDYLMLFVWFFYAFGVAAVFATIGGAVGLQSLSGFSKSVRKLANKSTIGTILGMVLLIVLTAFAIFSMGYAPVKPPEACQPI